MIKKLSKNTDQISHLKFLSLPKIIQYENILTSSSTLATLKYIILVSINNFFLNLGSS